MSFVRVEAQKQLLVATTGDSLRDHFYKEESGNILHNRLEFGSALGLLSHSFYIGKPLETLRNFKYLETPLYRTFLQELQRKESVITVNFIASI